MVASGGGEEKAVVVDRRREWLVAAEEEAPSESGVLAPCDFSHMQGIDGPLHACYQTAQFMNTCPIK